MDGGRDELKVYFDVGTLDVVHPSGVSVYILELVERLARVPEVDLQLVVKPSRLMRRIRLARFLGRPVKILYPWTGLGEREAIYHGPDFKLDSGLFLKSVVTVHDLGVFEGKYLPREFENEGRDKFKQMMRMSPDRVLANSSFTRQEILKHFPEFPQERVAVTPLGSDRSFVLDRVGGADAGAGAGALDVGASGPYILYVGQIDERKNVLGVVKAYDLLCKAALADLSQVPDLVLAGGHGNGSDKVFDFIAQSAFKNRIHVVGYVGDERLRELYKGAKIFVYPSFYEGFGLPILEAFHASCPVVTSNRGAMKEVAGDAAVLVNPDEPVEIMKGLESLLHNEGLRAELIEKGMARVSQFTWDKCCAETVAQYRRALG